MGIEGCEAAVGRLIVGSIDVGVGVMWEKVIVIMINVVVGSVYSCLLLAKQRTRGPRKARV